MINLLPPAEKDAIIYARYNTQLRRWILGSLIGLAGVIIVVLGGNIILQQNISDYDKAIASSKEQLKQQNQTETLEQVKGIQDNFTLVVDVLSREVLFSKLLPRVGQVMPTGTVLEGLSLTTEGEQTAFDLTAKATSVATGSQIHTNLTDPDNKLFKKADLVNVTCPSEQEEPSPYPCTVTMRVLPADANEFLLMKKEDKKK